MKLEIHSADVLHGFFIPAFRIKADAVPGRTTMSWFQATELGSYDIQCTVICGVDHSRMLSIAEIVSEDDFKAWYFGPEGTPEPNSATAAPKTAAAKVTTPHGSEPVELATMRQRGCLGCHSLDGAPMTGPSFKGLYGKRQEVVRDGTLEWVTVDEERITLAINEPGREVVRGYPPMPPVHIEPDELKAVVAYIKQLQ